MIFYMLKFLLTGFTLFFIFISYAHSSDRQPESKNFPSYSIREPRTARFAPNKSIRKVQPARFAPSQSIREAQPVRPESGDEVILPTNIQPIETYPPLRAEKIQHPNNSKNIIVEATIIEVYSDLEVALEFPKEVLKLNLSGQSFSYLPEDIYTFVNLLTLELEYVGLQEVSSGISKLRRLSYLNMSFNELIYFPEEICNLRNLGNLDLSDNQIDSIPDELKNFRRLSVLNLSNNNISDIPYAVDSLNTLTVLNLTGNPIPIWQIEEISKSLPNTKIIF